jgi:transketolase
MKEINNKARRIIIESSYKANACHIGSALSCVDILIDLYFKRMGKKDIFVFSKASGAAALYAVLSLKGYFPESKVAYYLKKFPLASRKVPGVLIDSGSLGHGLPQAVGMALADKKRNVWILMSDGELQEGTTWESLLFKKQHKLDNLKIIVDNNGWQACGKIKDILDIPWGFLKSMGVERIKTIKGRGISFMEGKNEWHYWNLNEDTYQRAIRELAD